MALIGLVVVPLVNGSWLAVDYLWGSMEKLRCVILGRIFISIIIGKTMRDEKKNETGYFVCGTSQNETG